LGKGVDFLKPINQTLCGMKPGRVCARKRAMHSSVKALSFARYGGPFPSEKRTIEMVRRTVVFKPRPESGIDCLTCAIFASTAVSTLCITNTSSKQPRRAHRKHRAQTSRSKWLVTCCLSQRARNLVSFTKGSKFVISHKGLAKPSTVNAAARWASNQHNRAWRS
jgi:hypothetical protein